MRAFSKCFGAMAAIVLMAGAAFAAEDVAAGKVKAINSDQKEFVLTDNAGKDVTFKLGDTVVINRGGKESQSDLNAGDAVNVCYDKGVFTWTARYILVQEGDTKDSMLMHGTIKNCDAKKKEMTFTDQQGKNWTFPMADAKVRLNKVASKIGDLKIGDSVLAIVDKVGETTSLRTLMIDRK